MPYKRTYRKKRYGRRRNRRGKSTWGNVASIAKTAFKTAKWVAGLVNAESKYFDVNLAPQAVDYNGYVSGPLCTPAQGVTALQRTGDSIKLQNLTLRLLLQQNTTTQELVRVIVFIDKENQSVNGNDVLLVTGTANAVLSPKNYNLRYDTKIIYDKTFRITSDNPMVKLDKVFRLDLHQNFVAGVTTVTNNAVKLLIIGQNSATGTNYSYYSHITYLDN